MKLKYIGIQKRIICCELESMEIFDDEIGGGGGAICYWISGYILKLYIFLVNVVEKNHSTASFYDNIF